MVWLFNIIRYANVIRVLIVAITNWIRICRGGFVAQSLDGKIIRFEVGCCRNFMPLLVSFISILRESPSSNIIRPTFYLSGDVFSVNWYFVSNICRTSLTFSLYLYYHSHLLAISFWYWITRFDYQRYLSWIVRKRVISTVITPAYM